MDKPQIQSPYTRFDIALEALSALIVLYITVLLLVKYGELPNTIATHFDMAGKADAWGSKSTVIVVWVVSIFLYILLTILNRYPWLFNYPVELTEDNVVMQYKLGARLVRILKLTMLIIFWLIMQSSLRAPIHTKDLLLGNYFVIVVFALTFLPIVYYFILARRYR